MNEPIATTVVVFDAEQYDGGDWPIGNYPARLVDCVAWFQRKLKLIPPEYRKLAQIDLESVSGYENSHFVHIRIEYQRPETEDERVDRIREETRKADERLAAEMELYRRLKTKYEPE